MAALETVLHSFIPSFAVDVVGVYTQDFNQIFSDARPVKAVIKEDSSLMEHPLEKGALTTDHRIILPVEIELFVLLTPSTFKATYDLIKQYFLKGTLLKVQTKTGVYDNQLIKAMPHEEDPEIFDTVILSIALKEVLFTTPQFGIVPRRATQGSTVSRGNLQPKAATAEQTDEASKLIKGYRFAKKKLSG